MTVQRLEATSSAAWTYVDDIGVETWVVLIRLPGGEVVRLDDAGVSSGQTAEGLRAFIAEWEQDAASRPGSCWPNDDTREVYRQMAEWVETL